MSDLPSHPTPVAYDSLAAALAAHHIDLPADQAALLDKYRSLLWEWNEKLNLTRHTDFESFVIRDVVDSLELAKLIPQEDEVLDVGSGGGVPGLVLAIIRPDLQVALCESVGKRARVLEDMVERLGLHVPVFHERAEAHLEDSRYGTVAARAVAPIA
ncbi:MAG: 16S rRNA (guanine(527)-N(7))-methyltransferase RsmG, partial [Planctomycetales bacterium]|nr:16S rRNA (guanine(527)-N(7))-methyltransferase RsmG [Planctomycetales bacterium]